MAGLRDWPKRRPDLLLQRGLTYQQKRIPARDHGLFDRCRTEQLEARETHNSLFAIRRSRSTDFNSSRAANSAARLPCDCYSTSLGLATTLPAWGLTSVVSDVLGKSGRRMLKALLLGVHDPAELASWEIAGCGPPRSNSPMRGGIPRSIAPPTRCGESQRENDCGKNYTRS
jgi:hypothetical protein